jgi:hypothetical protein
VTPLTPDLDQALNRITETFDIAGVPDVARFQQLIVDHIS